MKSNNKQKKPMASFNAARDDACGATTTTHWSPEIHNFPVTRNRSERDLRSYEVT